MQFQVKMGSICEIISIDINLQEYFKIMEDKNNHLIYDSLINFFTTKINNIGEDESFGLSLIAAIDPIINNNIDEKQGLIFYTAPMMADCGFHDYAAQLEKIRKETA